MGWVSGLLSLLSLHPLQTTSSKQSVRKKVDWAIHLEQSVMRMWAVKAGDLSFTGGCIRMSTDPLLRSAVTVFPVCPSQYQ